MAYWSDPHIDATIAALMVLGLVSGAVLLVLLYQALRDGARAMLLTRDKWERDLADGSSLRRHLRKMRQRARRIGK